MNLSLTQPVDLYCERTDFTFWAEPANAVTNLAFIVAGWMLLRLHRKAHNPSLLITTLITLTFAIGFGSFTFHTLATAGAALLDVIPIALFIHIYLFSFGRLLLRLGNKAAVFLVLSLVAFNIGFKALFPHAPDGIVSYMPSFLFLLGLAVFVWAKNHPARTYIISASAISFFSLTLRTIDNGICAVFPLGTHFLWHLCNASLIYLLVRPLIGYRGPVHDHC